MSRRREEEIAVGEDSFMDTIANLVGIMIILVVIVGARGYTTAESQAREKVQDKIDHLNDPIAEAENLERDLEKQIEQLQKYSVELAYRNAERMNLVDRKTMTEAEIDASLQSLDAQSQQRLAEEAQILELEKQLKELSRQQGELPETDKPVIALQHLPTPMAKTVFGKELHVMIQDHRVTVIPWELLIDQLKNQVRTTASRNSQRQRFDDVLGPIDGFMMRYRLLSKSGLMSDGRVATMGKMVELDRFELEATSEVVRESVEESLTPQGRLRTELDALRSSHTTVTVWVYPESFAEFRELKQRLYKEGFLCAARPLPKGMRIGGSPHGSSSSAQ